MGEDMSSRNEGGIVWREPTAPARTRAATDAELRAFVAQIARLPTSAECTPVDAALALDGLIEKARRLLGGDASATDQNTGGRG